MKKFIDSLDFTSAAVGIVGFCAFLLGFACGDKPDFHLISLGCGVMGWSIIALFKKDKE